MSHLVFSSLELVQNGFRFWSDIELGWIVHQEDNVSTVNEPLASIVEGEVLRDLFAYL